MEQIHNPNLYMWCYCDAELYPTLSISCATAGRTPLPHPRLTSSLSPWDLPAGFFFP